MTNAGQSFSICPQSDVNQGQYNVEMKFQGTGFSHNGTPVTLSTTATGVIFSNVTENEDGTTGWFDVSVLQSATPGFYPLTLTDGNGTVTLANALGIGNGPTLNSVTPSSLNQGTSTSITLNGGFLMPRTEGGRLRIFDSYGNDVSADFTEVSENAAMTSITGDFDGADLNAGTYMMYWDNGDGTYSNSVSFTINGPVVTGVTAVSGLTSTNSKTFTITGTGFQSGAVVAILNQGNEAVTSVSFVSSTTLNVTVSGGPSTVVAGKYQIKVVNPDGTKFITWDGALGIDEPGDTAPAASPNISTSDTLTAGSTGYLNVQTENLLVTTGSTVSFSDGLGHSFTGTVLYARGDNATIQATPARTLSTTLGGATTASSTSIEVNNVAGIQSGDVLSVSDGTNTTMFVAGAVAALSGTTGPGTIAVNSVLNGGGSFSAFAAGATITDTDPHGYYTMTIDNGTSSATASVMVNYPSQVVTTNGEDSIQGKNVADGASFSYEAILPGFNFGTSPTVTYLGSDGAASTGWTGTVTTTSANSAVITAATPSNTLVPFTADPTWTFFGPSGEIGIGSTYVCVTSAAGSNISAGDTLVASNSTTGDTQTFIVASKGTSGLSKAPCDDVKVNLDSASKYDFTGNTTTLTDSGYTTTDTDAPVYALVSNGNGGYEYLSLNSGAPSELFEFGLDHVPALSTVSTGFTSSGTPIAGQGYSNRVTFTFGITPGSTAADFCNDDIAPMMYSADTDLSFSGVTCGTSSGVITVYANMTVSSTASVGFATVKVALEQGLKGTYSKTIGIVAGPKITAVSNVGSLGEGGSASFLIQGSGLTGVSVSDLSFSNSLGGPDASVTASSCYPDSDSAVNCTVNVGEYAWAGPDTVTVTSTLNGGTATSATPVVTVTGGAITNLSMSNIPYQYDGTFTATVSGLGYTQFTNLDGFCTLTDGTDTHGCIATYVNASTVSISFPGHLSDDFTAGDSVYLELESALDQSTGAESYDALTVVSRAHVDGVTASAIVAGTTSSVTIYGSNFTPGLKLIYTGTGVTSTVSAISPNSMTVSITVAANASTDGTFYVGYEDSSTALTGEAQLTIVPAPTITSINGVSTSGASTVDVLAGTSGTLTIQGTGFVEGATVSASSLATFGTATVGGFLNGNDGGYGTTITVPVTYGTYTGVTPFMINVTVTNPNGFGSVTATNAIQVNPGPSVTGTYYVAPSTTNLQVAVTGYNFASGMTVSSTNSDFTVSIVNESSNVANILVSTDAAAVQGTSTVVTFTNTDGGTASFSIYGGVAPVNPHLSKVTGAAHAGTTRYLTVHGTSIPSSKPKITSNAAGAKVTVVWAKWGTAISIKVTTPSTTKAGWHKLTLKWGSVTRTVSYLQN